MRAFDRTRANSSLARRGQPNSPHRQGGAIAAACSGTGRARRAAPPVRACGAGGTARATVGAVGGGVLAALVVSAHPLPVWRAAGRVAGLFSLCGGACCCKPATGAPHFALASGAVAPGAMAALLRHESAREHNTRAARALVFLPLCFVLWTALTLWAAFVRNSMSLNQSDGGMTTHAGRIDITAEAATSATTRGGGNSSRARHLRDEAGLHRARSQREAELGPGTLRALVNGLTVVRMAERQQLWQRPSRDDSDSTNARPGDDARRSSPHARLLLASAEEEEVTGEASDHGSVAFGQMESAGATDTTLKQLRASEQLQTPATNGDPAAPSRRACAPTYFIVGARKGGTTALFRWLLEAAPGAVVATPELLREGDTPGAGSPRAEALAGETGFFARPRTIAAARAQLRAHAVRGADSPLNRARRSRPLANSETKARDELQRLVREYNGHWFPAEVQPSAGVDLGDVADQLKSEADGEDGTVTGAALHHRGDVPLPIAGEASVAYAATCGAMEALAAACGSSVRIIYILREPLARAQSQFLMRERLSPGLTLPRHASFEEVFADDVERFRRWQLSTSRNVTRARTATSEAGTEHALQQPCWGGAWPNNYVWDGLYELHLRRIMRAFPDAGNGRRMLVLRSEDVWAHPEEALGHVLQWLGVANETHVQLPFGKKRAQSPALVNARPSKLSEATQRAVRMSSRTNRAPSGQRAAQQLAPGELGAGTESQYQGDERLLVTSATRSLAEATFAPHNAALRALLEGPLRAAAWRPSSASESSAATPTSVHHAAATSNDTKEETQHMMHDQRDTLTGDRALDRGGRRRLLAQGGGSKWASGSRIHDRIVSGTNGASFEGARSKRGRRADTASFLTTSSSDESEKNKPSSSWIETDTLPASVPTLPTSDIPLHCVQGAPPASESHAVVMPVDTWPGFPAPVSSSVPDAGSLRVSTGSEQRAGAGIAPATHRPVVMTAEEAQWWLTRPLALAWSLRYGEGATRARVIFLTTRAGAERIDALSYHRGNVSTRSSTNITDVGGTDLSWLGRAMKWLDMRVVAADMPLEESAFDADHLADLRAGPNCCSWREFFMLRAWGMTEYARVAVVDTDLFFVGSLDPLLTSECFSGQTLASAARGTPLNAGMIVMEPSTSVLAEMIDALRRGAYDPAYGWNAEGWPMSLAQVRANNTRTCALCGRRKVMIGGSSVVVPHTHGAEGPQGFLYWFFTTAGRWAAQVDSAGVGGAELFIRTGTAGHARPATRTLGAHAQTSRHTTRARAVLRATSGGAHGDMVYHGVGSASESEVGHARGALRLVDGCEWNLLCNGDCACAHAAHAPPQRMAHSSD